MLVGGVENFRYHLGHCSLFHALDIFALGEQIHVKLVGAPGIPESELIYLASSVTGYEHISRNCHNGGIALVFGMIVTVFVPIRHYLSAETHFDRLIISRDKPAFSGYAPVVRDLGLLPVFKLLLEYPEFVAYGISGAFKPQSGHAVHITGGKSSEASVAEPRVGFSFKDVRRVSAQIFYRSPELISDPEVKRVFHKASAHQKFHGKVMDFLFCRVCLFIYCDHSAHYFAQHHRASHEELFVRGFFACCSEIRAQFVFYRAPEFIS